MPIFMDSTHTYFFILMCLLTLAPSVNLSVDTLAKAKRLTHFYSVASLLEKWFACFQTSGDSLRSLFCSLCTHLTVNTFIKLDCFLP